MSKPSKIIVLAEDSRHKQLIQRYLKRRGYQQHEWTFESSPSGRGSAENWVRNNFARQVSACRNRSRGRRAETALIVMIDADALSIQSRLAQLDTALAESGSPAIDPDSDRVARLIPKRNVETWILCLNERAVNEVQDYKAQAGWNWNELIPSAAETLSNWRTGNFAPSLCVDSLQFGLGELRRVDL